MDPSTIIAQVDRDAAPVASNKKNNNSGSANEVPRKGNMKKHLAILRDRLLCCARPNTTTPPDNLPSQGAQKNQNIRPPIYNPANRNNNVSVVRRNHYNGTNISESGGRSDVPLLSGGGDAVSSESVVLSESPSDDVSQTGKGIASRQQGRGVLYEVHLSTSITSIGRQSSPSQVATTNNGDMSVSNENRNRSSSSFSSGANGHPTTSTPLGQYTANNASGRGNTGRPPQVFSPSPISGVLPSAPPNAPGRRITYQANECSITINSQTGQATAGASSTSFSLLLGAPRHDDRHKPCLIIDLDETLVHSSFKPIPNADFIVPVEIDGTIYQVYVQKRPHVDEFLQRVGQLFECVLFTASLAKYADPVADLLDKWGVFRARLFREACVFIRGNYVKDLGQLGREIDAVAIIDNSPASYLLHPENAIPVTSWFDDPSDTQLLELLPVLDRLAANLAPGIRQSGARELLRELIGPTPQVSPLAPPTPVSGSHSIVTSAVNPNTQSQQQQQQQQQQQSSQKDSGLATSSAMVTMNSNSTSSTSAQSGSPPASPFSPQPVQLVVVGPNVNTASTIHHVTPAGSSGTRTQLRSARYNLH